MTAPLLALIDDDCAILGFMQDVLRDAGYRVALWMSSEGAEEMLVREQPALVVLDLGLEERYAGMTVLHEIRHHPVTERLPVLICSADGQFLEEHAADLQVLGCAVLEKPFLLEELVSAVETMLGTSYGDAVA